MEKLKTPYVNTANIKYEEGNVLKKYVVGTAEALDEFFNSNEFKHANLSMMVTPIRKAINRGEVVLITDNHPMSGMPTYHFLNSTMEVLDLERWEG